MGKEPWEHAVEARRVNRTMYRTRTDGYVEIESTGFGTHDRLFLHQLVAIADGADPYQLFGGPKQIHHKNGIRWDNRPSNIEVVNIADHARRHGDDMWGEAPWRDPDEMREGLKKMSGNRLAEVWGCAPRTITKWRKRHDLPPGEPGRKQDKQESTS